MEAASIDFPHVDPEVSGEHGELVDQGDVHVAERVLEELGELGHPGARHRHGLLDDAVEESPHGEPGTRASIPDTTFGMVTRFHVGIAGIDALGAVAEVEVDPGAEARTLLEDGRHELLGGPGIRRGLEDDGGARFEVAGQDPGSLLDVGQVGVAVGRAAWGRR